MRRFFLFVIATVFLMIGLIVMLAWLYVFVVTHPGCFTPRHISGFPFPEEHWITTMDGRSLRLWYYPSRNGAAVIAMGGLDGSLGDALPPIAPLLREGFGVVQIDSRACAIPAGIVSLGYLEAEDVIMAVKFLESRSEVTPTRIGAIGFSMGGSAVIRAAVRHPEIKAVISEGNYYNLGKDIIAEGEDVNILHRAFLYLVAWVFEMQMGVSPWEISPLDDIAQISPRPLLLIFGEKELASGKGYLQYQAARPPKELWVVPGGAHGSNYRVAKEEYERRLINFFEGALLK